MITGLYKYLLDDQNGVCKVSHQINIKNERRQKNWKDSIKQNFWDLVSKFHFWNRNKNRNAPIVTLVNEKSWTSIRWEYPQHKKLPLLTIDNKIFYLNQYLVLAGNSKKSQVLKKCFTKNVAYKKRYILNGAFE